MCREFHSHQCYSRGWSRVGLAHCSRRWASPSILQVHAVPHIPLLYLQLPFFSDHVRSSRLGGSLWPTSCSFHPWVRPFHAFPYTPETVVAPSPRVLSYHQSPIPPHEWAGSSLAYSHLLPQPIPKRSNHRQDRWKVHREDRFLQRTQYVSLQLLATPP